MIDLDEINRTILKLEQNDTTFATCEKLADLYIVRDHLTAQAPKQLPQLDITGDSPFLKAIDGKDSIKIWAIIDELMESERIVNPRVYDSVMRKIEAIK